MKIAKHLKLPNDAPARTIAVFGQKGSGKTYLAMVLTEAMLEAGVQVVCLDPTGVWWGLKAEGTGPGFPILVMGGDHGDVPLTYTSGTIVADFVVQSAQSVVLDLSHFNSNAEQDRFVADFAERLYRAMNTERRALHVMMDEADSFAPQNPQRKGYEVRMLGAIETIVRRGRSRGLGMTMITQRPAVLNKNVVEQADLIISTRIVGKNDHAALRDMTKLRATKEQMDNFLGTVPQLPNGEAFFWSPEWLDLFHVHEILKKRTYDSSKTPAPGEKRKAPKLAAIDLSKLTAEIQATVDAAKQNDPNELRAAYHKLKQEHAKQETQLSCALSEVHKLRNAPPAEVQLLSKGDRALLENLMKLLHELGISHLVDLAQTAHGTLNKIFVALDHPKPARLPTKERVHLTPPPAPWKPITKAVVAAARPTSNGSDVKINGSQQRILDALAWYESINMPEPSNIQIGAVAQIDATGGHWSNLVGPLSTAGLVERRQGSMSLTAAGRALAREPEGTPTIDGYHEMLRNRILKMKSGSRKTVEMLNSIIRRGGNQLTTADIGEDVGIDHTGGHFSNTIGPLGTLGLIERRQGTVIPTQILFPPLP